jgi:hypothetical protein
MSVSATIKNISITGVAAEDFQKGKGTRRRRSRRNAPSESIETMEPSSITFIPSGKTNIIRSGGGDGEAPVVTQTVVKNNIPPHHHHHHHHHQHSN